MQQIGVDRERRLAALVLGDRNLVRFGERDQLLARAQIPFAPRRDDGDVGLQRIIAEFEADLIVSLAGRTMRHRVGADLLGDLDLLLGDQRSRDRGAEQILSFIHRIGAEHRKHVVADEFLAQILDEDIFRLDAEQQRLLARGLELLALAEIGGEGHDLAAIGGLQPLQDDRCVEAARIGEHHLLDVLAHENPAELDCRNIAAGHARIPQKLNPVLRSEYAQMITGRTPPAQAGAQAGSAPTARAGSTDSRPHHLCSRR